MVARYRGGTLAAASADDSPVATLLEPLGTDVADALDGFDLTGALERIWEVVRALNRHVEATAPWQLAKDEAHAEELDRVLYDLVDGLRAVAVALAAYLPGDLRRASSRRWVSRRASPGTRSRTGARSRSTGIEAAAPLFPRVDAPATAA